MKEERFSSGTPSKNKISNFGAISSLYPNFTYHPLSLNLKKNKSQEKTFIFVDCPIIICFDTLKVYVTVVKESHIFMLPRGLCCYFMLPFQLLFALCYLAKSCPINSLKVSHGKPELPTTTI